MDIWVMPPSAIRNNAAEHINEQVFVSECCQFLCVYT